MYQRDYVLRLIEQFGRVLVALRNRILRREADAADVRAEVHEMARQAGLDLDIARSLDPGMLLIWLAPTGDVDPPKFWLLAELLYLDALQARQGTAGSGGHTDLERALALFSRLPPDWRPFDEFASAGERAGEVRRLLDEG
ncbi:MAG TPA: hypothetical protein VLD67_15290 [Vicinamibacterales bacterium]|nr:hypothetical protein [Vicinamibacterales bacterium]